MKTPLTLGLILLLALPAATPAFADDETPKLEKHETITLVMRDATVLEVIAKVAEMAGKNVIVSPDVGNEKLTVHWKDTPWRDALDALAKASGGVLVEEQHGIFRIIPAKRKAGPVMGAMPPLPVEKSKRHAELMKEIAASKARIAELERAIARVEDHEAEARKLEGERARIAEAQAKLEAMARAKAQREARANERLLRVYAVQDLMAEEGTALRALVAALGKQQGVQAKWQASNLVVQAPRAAHDDLAARLAELRAASPKPRVFVEWSELTAEGAEEVIEEEIAEGEVQRVTIYDLRDVKVGEAKRIEKLKTYVERKGGSAKWTDDKLIVRAPERVHRLVAKTLETLRRRAAAREATPKPPAKASPAKLLVLHDVRDLEKQMPAVRRVLGEIRPGRWEVKDGTVLVAGSKEAQEAFRSALARIRKGEEPQVTWYARDLPRVADVPFVAGPKPPARNPRVAHAREQLAEAQARLENLAQAHEHLQQAGAAREAAEVAKQMAAARALVVHRKLALERETRAQASSRRAPPARDGASTAEAIRMLRREVHGLRGEVSELTDLVRKLIAMQKK